jgi:hypothetical protein
VVRPKSSTRLAPEKCFNPSPQGHPIDRHRFFDTSLPRVAEALVDHEAALAARLETDATVEEILADITG